ncbi:MAG: alpha/beta fold hydrolase, partial [Candidatus Dormibacteria bacterium]
MIPGPAASPAGAARGSTVTGEGGGRLSVRQWGAPASPPVLLVHGYPDTSQVWDRVAPILARQYQV